MDTLTQQIIFLIIKINNFRGDLSGISAKTATLVKSVLVVADLLVELTRQLFSFIRKATVYRAKVPNNHQVQF